MKSYALIIFLESNLHGALAKRLDISMVEINLPQPIMNEELRKAE
jgi:hypothetical protein